MSEQGSLFAAPKAREPPTRLSRKLDLAFSALKNPGGAPDKRGKYPYEKFHREAMKFGDAARVRFFETLLSMDATTFSHVIEIGVMWNERSIGLRGLDRITGVIMTDYRAYLERDTWTTIREQRLAMDGYECVLCGAPAENVHHRRYPKVLGGETILALVSLCRGVGRRLWDRGYA